MNNNTNDLSQDIQGDQIAAEPDTRTVEERREALFRDLRRVNNDLASLEEAAIAAWTVESVTHVATVLERLQDAFNEF